MEIIDNISLDSTVKHMKAIGNGSIFFSDSASVFYIADLNDKYSLKRKNRIGSLTPEQQKLNMHEFSADGRFLAINDRTKKRVNVFDFQNKKPHFTIDWHVGEIESMAFDNQNGYIATGGQDGKGFLWSLATGKLTYALPPHSDFVTAIAFNKSGSWVATGSYDSKVRVTNIYAANKTVDLVGGHTGYVKFINFISDNRLVTIDKNGGAVVWDYVNGKMIKQLKGIDSDPTSVTFIYDDNFMLVSTILKTIALFNLKNYEYLTRNFIKVGDVVTDFSYLPELELLVVATALNDLRTYDLKSDESILQQLVIEKNFVQAYKLLDENPTLYISPIYKTLEAIWDKIYKEAYVQLEKLNIQGAKDLFEPYKGIPAKTNYIQNLLNDFAEFQKFVNFVETKKFALAYQLAFKYPTYKESKYYTVMEEEWNTQMDKVKVLITNMEILQN